MHFSLRCHLCGTTFPPTALWVCDQCLGPLEVTYDYAAIAPLVSRALIESRPKNLWRYREFLPIANEPLTGLHSGFTPLVRADRLAKRLGVRELYVKDDSVNHPTCSYKDRVVSIAATRAVELGLQRVRLRVDRQPRQQRRLARGEARPRLLGLHPRRPRARQGHRRRGLPAAHHRRARQLRRRQPAVHAGRGSVSVGIRQHQPARLLRRGREDLRLRDCRAARLALPAARRVAGRRRHAAAAHPQGIHRAARGRTGRWRAAVDPRRTGRRMRTGRSRARRTAWNSPSR